MDTAVVVIVLILVLGIAGWIGWLLIRQAGWERTKLLITAPLLGTTAKPEALAARPANVSLDAGEANERPVPAVSDEALRSLREEVHGELLRATGLTREFDARLTKIEALYTNSRRTPDELEATIQEIDARQTEAADSVRRELAKVQRTSSTFGERRVAAVSELYAQLARVEAALASVVNPALLPGEPLSLPAELGNDAYVWDNWRDVGDRAYAFGTVFNQHRYVLDAGVATSIEAFITTLRQALTGAVYPNVQGGAPSAEQRAQIRTGLAAIVGALPEIRRHLEHAYRADTVE